MSRWAYELPVQATLRDTDGLGHVNNAVYVTWFEEVRTRYVMERRKLARIEECDFVLASTSASFKAPVYMHELVVMRCAPTKVGTTSWSMAYEGRGGDGRLVVLGESVQVQYDFGTRVKAPLPPEWRLMLIEDGAEG